MIIIIVSYNREMIDIADEIIMHDRGVLIDQGHPKKVIAKHSSLCDDSQKLT